MIDEELYQFASDELNSDRRKPDIWARACALASDDHDEARYLYTNLRVEQLLAEREAETANRTLSGGQPSFDLDAEHDMDRNATQDDTQELAPELSLDTPHSQKPLADLSDLAAAEGLEYTPSQRPGMDDGRSTPSSVEELFAATNDALTQDLEEQRPVSVPGTESLDAIAPREDDLDAGAVMRMNNEQSEVLSAFDGKPLHSRSDDFADEAPVAHANADDELQWLDQKIDSEKTVLQAHRVEARQQADELAQEFERQAVELPGQDSDVVAFADRLDTVTVAEPIEDSSDTVDRAMAFADSPGLRTETVATAAVAASPVSASEDTEAVSDERPKVKNDYAEPANYEADRIEEISAEDFPLDAGGGRSWSVFSREDGTTKAVKQGVSWPALFFTFPWLLSRRLFGTAIIYALLWLVIMVGLISTGLDWLDAGPQASQAIKLLTLGFALLALVGLLWLPFRYGNQWIARKLEKRGFEFQTLVKAASKRDAIARVLRFAS